MASVDGMAAWWSRSLIAAALLTAPAAAEIGPAERQEIARLAEARGTAPSDVAPLVDEIDRAAARGLPATSLLNKLKEGLSKGVPPARVHGVLRDMASRMDVARDLLGAVPDEAARTRSIEVLAEALGRGATAADVKEIARLAKTDGGPSSESLAFGAKSWALMREAGIPAAGGVGLVVEAMRQGFRPAELLTLAREVGARREDFETGRLSLDAVREAVRRGERPERVLPPQRPERPQRPPDRPERPADKPERQQPPAERPERPERPPR